MFMFHNVIASSALIKILTSKRKTLLLTVFLSRRVIRSLINSVSRVIMKKMSKYSFK